MDGFLSSDIEKFHVTAIVIVVLIKIVIYYLITAALIIITGKYMDVSEATTSISLIILFMGTPTYPPTHPCHIFQNKQEGLKKKTTHHTHHHVLEKRAEG